MNVISNTADPYQIGTDITADRCKISMHVLPHLTVAPGFAILSAKDDVEDDLAYRLRHAAMLIERGLKVNRAFSVNDLFLPEPGA